MNNFLDNYLIEIKKLNFNNPELELRVLLNNCLFNLKNEIFLKNFDLSKINVKKFKSAFNRRIKHEPLSKIFNKKEFWGLEFYVDKYVLDPRPESEFLIQTIKEYFKNYKSNIKICDLGTGSGCLAITLAKIYNKSKITAIDISDVAIEVAKKNAKKHKVGKKINFINCDWIFINRHYDLVVSNPPYLSNKQYEDCELNIKNFEPKLALVGGSDGLESYRQIAEKACSILHNHSYLFIEIGFLQTNDIRKIFAKKNLKIIKIVKDYQQIDRVLVLKYDSDKKKLA